MILNEFFNLPQVFEKQTDEGIFGSRPSPVLPIVDKIAKVASGLTPQNVEVGKQIIQNKASEITRMLNPQVKAGVDVIEQGVAEDSTAHDCKHCNGKGYHTVTKKDGTKVATNCPQCKGKGYIVTKGMAEGVRTESAELAKQYDWAYNQGEYGASMTHPKHGRISLSSPVTSRSGDTAVEREWTHNNASGIGDRSLAQHLQSLKEQGVSEAKDDYVPPKEADYGPEYQAMVRRVGEKARAQEKAKQQQPKAPVRESRLALLKQIIQS
jgi:Zn finger protein HypA/HybF involved in hydrogenase expression